MARRMMIGCALIGVALGAHAGGLEITDGYVREMPPGQTVSAAFMVLRNTTAQPIALVAATTDAADRAEIHGHRHSASGMSMHKVLRLEVPAGATQPLQPGGYHLMLIGLKRPLRAGDQVGITLLDEMGKSYSARVPVTKMVGAAGPDGGHAHH
jgi:copper(I)-binding protein